MQYSFSQLEDLWTNNGGSAALAPIMAAIGLAESSGDPNAYLPKDSNGLPSAGLWQINGANSTSPELFNPNYNASEAVSIYNSQGLKAWGTYTSGAYKQFLDGSSSVAGGSSASQASSASSASSSSLLNSGPAFTPVAVPTTVTRIFAVVATLAILFAVYRHKRSS